jgi:hypothetical protein
MMGTDLRINVELRVIDGGCHDVDNLGVFWTDVGDVKKHQYTGHGEGPQGDEEGRD